MDVPTKKASIHAPVWIGKVIEKHSERQDISMDEGTIQYLDDEWTRELDPALKEMREPKLYASETDIQMVDELRKIASELKRIRLHITRVKPYCGPK